MILSLSLSSHSTDYTYRYPNLLIYWFSYSNIFYSNSASRCETNLSFFWGISGMRPLLCKCCHRWAKLLCCPQPRHSRVSWHRRVAWTVQSHHVAPCHTNWKHHIIHMQQTSHATTQSLLLWSSGHSIVLPIQGSLRRRPWPSWGLYFPAPTWEERDSCNATQCAEPPVFRILCRKAARSPQW